MIKESLSMVIPILFTGSITVLLNSFPIMGYQDFLDSFMGGALRNILQIVQVTTVGVLAVYLTVALNLSYTNRIDNNERLVFRFGSLMTCLAGFFILVGFTPANPDFNLLGGQGVFCALLAGLIGSALYRKFEVLFEIRKNIFVDGADSIFNAALHVILPFTAAILCIAAENYLITVCFSVESVRELFTKVVNAIFSGMDRGSYGSGLLYTVLVGVMWWFGIHGNKVLNQVETEMFAEIIPGQIVSKSFMDTFVIMGGTGCLIGLLLAMIIFG
ncbi:MAG: PTS sugar transporter subunit IIC, partial [Lachnospiraceae bacterium]|nr:PTS sugar transporter subunit IIC [Lachnospiraceae bacterium]